MKHINFPYAMTMNPTTEGSLGLPLGFMDLLSSAPTLPEDNFDPSKALMGGTLMDLSKIILGEKPDNGPLKAYQIGRQMYDKDQQRKFQRDQLKYQNKIALMQLMATMKKAGMPVSNLGKIVYDTFGGTKAINDLQPGDWDKVNANIQRMQQPKGLSTADLNEVAAGVASGKIPPTDSRYAVWWMMNSQPRTQFDPGTGMTTTITPDLSRFPVPPESTLNKAATDDQQTDLQTDQQPIEMGSKGGVEVTQGTPILTGAEATKYRDAITKAQLLQSDLARVKELAADYFVTPFDQNKRRRLQTAYKNAQLAFKEFANLGVLTGPDVEIIEDFLPPPTDLSMMTKILTGVVDYNEVIDEASRAFERQSNIYQQKLGGTAAPSQQSSRSARVDALLEKVK